MYLRIEGIVVHKLTSVRSQVFFFIYFNLQDNISIQHIRGKVNETSNLMVMLKYLVILSAGSLGKKTLKANIWLKWPGDNDHKCLKRKNDKKQVVHFDIW